MARKKNKGLSLLAWWLVLVGAINWGVLGVSQLFSSSSVDIVGWIFGGMASTVSSVVYAVVGLSGLYLLWQMYN